MEIGRLFYYPLNHTRPGAYADFESALEDVVKFQEEHEPTMSHEVMQTVLRYNFVLDDPNSVIVALFYSPENEPEKLVRVGHLWIAVDEWFGNKILNVMQYQISLPPLTTVPIEDKKRLLSDVMSWGKKKGAIELRTVAYGDALRRAYRMFYGITNDRNDYVIRKPL